jgi:hypothetical protein
MREGQMTRVMIKNAGKKKKEKGIVEIVGI